MRKILLILIGLSLLIFGYIYIKKIVPHPGEVCDPQEETKMPETFN